MSNFSMIYIRYVYEDILKLYARFGYEEFTRSQTNDIDLYYSIKRLSNNSVISKSRKIDGVIQYKLSKYVVEACEKYSGKH